MDGTFLTQQQQPEDGNEASYESNNTSDTVPVINVIETSEIGTDNADAESPDDHGNEKR